MRSTAKVEETRIQPTSGTVASCRLDSWKDIADYLNRSVRCVQRWERVEGLPVRRLRHQRNSSVYAIRTELDDWYFRRTTRAAKNCSNVFARPKLIYVSSNGHPLRSIAAERTTWTW